MVGLPHYDYDWPTAERKYETNVELNPSYASAAVLRPGPDQLTATLPKPKRNSTLPTN